MKKTKKSKSEDIVFNVTPKAKPVLGELHVGATLRSLFFFLIIVAPIAVFAWIIYNSKGIAIYKKSDVWNHMDVPNVNQMFILFWCGIALIIITVLMISLFGIISRYVRNKRVQSAYVSMIVVVAAVGILLAALSQYFFAKIYEFINYEMITDPANVQDWASEISKDLVDNRNNHNSDATALKWIPSSVVWWVMFVQFMFVFGVEVTLQNALNSDGNLNDYEKYISDSKQESAGIDFNKFNRFFKNTFRATDKSVAMFLIIAAIVIVIPNFVYSVLGTVPGTNMAKTIDWGYRIPNLIKDVNFGDDKVVSPVLSELTKAKYGNGFVVSSLPIIMEGLTISSLFLFLAMLLRGKNVSNRIFLVETTILFVEVIALISVSLASKVYIERVSNELMPKIDDFSKEIAQVLHGKNGADFLGNYPAPSSTKHIEWLDPAATIAEAIIAYAWVLGCFGLIGNAIYKLGYFKKDSLVTYESGILNN